MVALSVPITVTDCTTGYYLDNIPFAYISSIVSLVCKDGRREFEWVDDVRSQRSGKLIKLDKGESAQNCDQASIT